MYTDEGILQPWNRKGLFDTGTDSGTETVRKFDIRRAMRQPLAALGGHQEGPTKGDDGSHRSKWFRNLLSFGTKVGVSRGGDQRKESNQEPNNLK